MYIDMLLRWNARVNLTAVRDPEHIVTRHFGESLFTALHLFPHPADASATSRIAPPPSPPACAHTPGSSAAPVPGTQFVVDVGSGPGFPGLPIKIWAPTVRLTLIESNHKKATFLREVIRALKLDACEVFTGRAEDFPLATADVVTLRAVERFDSVLPIAARLVRPGGRLALLIGDQQSPAAHRLLPQFQWAPPSPLPLSSHRLLLIGLSISS